MAASKATEAMIGTLIEKVFSALLTQAQYALDFKDQLEAMKTKLELMTAFISCTDKQKTRGEFMQKILPNLRKIIYEADDIMTDCQIRDEYRKDGFCHRFSLRDCFFIYQTGKDLKHINSRIEKMESSLGVYGRAEQPIIQQGPNNSSYQIFKYSPEDREPSEIIGLEKDLEKIKGWILSSNEKLQQIGIVLVNSKMAENVDEGNENDFEENDNVSQENENLRRNRPFIEYFKQEAKILREQGKKVKNGGYGSSKVNLREIHPQQNTAQETFDGTSQKNEECIHNCQHQKELSLVRKDIGHMALELDGLKHSMGSWMQQMQQVMETLKENLTQKQVEQQKENNGAAVGITSPSRKQQKNDESSHEILTFVELMKRAKERPDGDDILEKKLLDEENVEEKHDERILMGESDLNEGKRKQIFYNAAIQ